MIFKNHYANPWADPEDRINRMAAALHGLKMLDVDLWYPEPFRDIDTWQRQAPPKKSCSTCSNLEQVKPNNPYKQIHFFRCALSKNKIENINKKNCRGDYEPFGNN